MGCASCGRNKVAATGYGSQDAMNNPPFRSNDIMVLENNEVHRFTAGDWPDNRNKVLLFVDPNNPASTSEIEQLRDVSMDFSAINTDLYIISSDQMHIIRDWLRENSLEDVTYKVLSSYLLPIRLNIMNNGRNKLATVFITTDGHMIIQEMFPKVARNIQDVYRTIAAFVSQEYIKADWQPINGVSNEGSETQ